MHIAYFAHLNGGSQTGVAHKIVGQVGRWRANGHVVRVFVATRDSDVESWALRLGDSLVLRYERPFSRLRVMTRLVQATAAFEPDIVYLRWDLFYPPMLWFPKRAKLVIEVNSDDLREYALGSRIRATYNARTRGAILTRADAVVFVTSELSGGPSFAGLPGRRLVIANGVDLAEYPVLAAPRNHRPRLVFAGTANQPWHGIDKLMSLAGLRSHWDFDIIGPDGGLFQSHANVSWHANLGRVEVLTVLAKADVGVGTLALHRKSMDQAVPLKAREYLAVGLPVLYGHSDPDVDSLGAAVLRIANTESNVLDALSRIDGFVLASRGLRIPRSRLAHIDVAVKEQERLALFDELVRP